MVAFIIIRANPELCVHVLGAQRAHDLTEKVRERESWWSSLESDLEECTKEQGTAFQDRNSILQRHENARCVLVMVRYMGGQSIG